MFEPSEGSDNVGPADLPCPLMVCVVSREHVRADDTAKDLAKDPFEDFCTSGGCQGEESHGRGHENPKPDPLAHAFPPRLVHVENLLFGKSLFDFLTAWFKGLGYFLVKFAHRAKGDINPEEGLGKLLTSSSGHPMHGGEVGKESSKSGTEAGSSLGWDIRPGDGAAGTFDTTKLVFGDVRFDLGNLYHLAAKVIAEHTATIHTGVKRFVTNLTRLGKDLLDQINLLSGNQIPVCPLVTRLPSRLAMPGFLAPSHFWFACRTVGRRWLGGIGRILGEKGYFSLQFSHFLCKKIHCTAQLQQDLHDHFSVAVRNGYGFFPSHGESQYQDQPLWQEEIEKRRDMARLQISSNDQKGLTQAKPGGRLTPPGERLPKRNLESTNSLYRRALVKMKEATKEYIEYTNQRKDNLEAAREKEMSTKAVPIKSLPDRPKMKLPTVDKKPKVKMVTIQYKRPEQEVKKVAASLGSALMSYKDVGILTYEYYMENEMEE